MSGRMRDGKIARADIRAARSRSPAWAASAAPDFTPIVNYPEVAILGVARSQMKPVWDGGQFVPRLMLPLSLSYDHRVIDGALAARFTRRLADGWETCAIAAVRREPDMESIEVQVPDIGDYKDVPMVEIHVKPGTG